MKEKRRAFGSLLVGGSAVIYGISPALMKITFAYGGKSGRSMESSIEHFHDKLLLLKDGLNTEEAKRIGEARHAFLEQFLTEYENEVQVMEE